jgi:hypothetical protein
MEFLSLGFGTTGPQVQLLLAASEARGVFMYPRSSEWACVSLSDTVSGACAADQQRRETPLDVLSPAPSVA